MTRAERIAAIQHIISQLPANPPLTAIVQITLDLGYAISEIGWPYLERAIDRAAEKARRERADMRRNAA